MKDQQMLYKQRASDAEEVLEKVFWDDENHVYKPYTLEHEEEFDGFHYWWQAHAMDVLIDAYERTKDQKYLDRVEIFLDGILRRNKGSIINDFYDDMEWMALALLRAYKHTKELKYKEVIDELWEDIQGAWNDICGGGLAWQKKQLYYKNTPANAPAIILATRLYRTFGIEQDLEFAKKIFAWQEENLVDPETGFVWDGMNRNDDMEIDKNWEFTYCQGVYIGACVELFKVTKDGSYLEKAKQTTHTAFERLADQESKVLNYEGMGDSGLFKGIFIRYVENYLYENYDQEIVDYLLENGEQAWKSCQAHSENLFGAYWNQKNDTTKITLSTHLSGCMLLESIGRLLQTSEFHN